MRTMLKTKQQNNCDQIKRNQNKSLKIRENKSVKVKMNIEQCTINQSEY